MAANQGNPCYLSIGNAVQLTDCTEKDKLIVYVKWAVKVKQMVEQMLGFVSKNGKDLSTDLLAYKFQKFLYIFEHFLYTSV